MHVLTDIDVASVGDANVQDSHKEARDGGKIEAPRHRDDHKAWKLQTNADYKGPFPAHHIWYAADD
jgi:hypothetical protein